MTLFDLPPSKVHAAWEATPEHGDVRYPVYIPSLGRVNHATTPAMLGDLPYKLVVEAAEHQAYRDKFGDERVLSLPGDDYGYPAFVRNWIKDHATAEGHRRHWQVDDNISKIQRVTRTGDKNTYVNVDARAALGRVERFVDLHVNIAIAGIAHVAFAWTSTEPFLINKQVYSCVLVENDALRWRKGVIEDTDYSLQVLAMLRCTLLVTDYAIHKHKTGVMPGGNTKNIYQGDGRLRNIAGLQQAWPHLDIGLDERFGKPVAVTGHVWRRFKQKPKLVEHR